MQVEAGAQGITCAKVSEAETMAAGGLRDIFIAYPMVGAFRIRRALALAPKLDRLILAVDSWECARELSDAAQAAGLCLEVRLEIDTGAGRTGVPLEHAAALAQRIAAMPGAAAHRHLHFQRAYLPGRAHAGQHPCRKRRGRDDGRGRAQHRAAGVAIQDVSAGSSPTGVAVAQTGLVTEVRPGTYIFKDQMLCGEHVAEPEQIAVRYAATVVSVQHGEYAVLDGGSKTFATDIPLNTPPFYYPGYAAVEGRPDLCLSRMNEEHGILTAACGQTKLKVGDVLTLVPIHVCTAVNQQNAVYLLENGRLTRHPVDARGMTV